MSDRFWKWFDGVTAEANESPVGKAVTPRGWTLQHTGGGCLAWELTKGKHYAMITLDEEFEGNFGEVGIELTQAQIGVAPFVVGIYNEDGDYSEGFVKLGITRAMDWCEDALNSDKPLTVTAFTVSVD